MITVSALNLGASLEFSHSQNLNEGNMAASALSISGINKVSKERNLNMHYLPKEDNLTVPVFKGEEKHGKLEKKAQAKPKNLS